MAEAFVKREEWVILSLRLTQDEANTLRAMMQNPVDGDDDTAQALRYTIFQSLCEKKVVR